MATGRSYILLTRRASQGSVRIKLPAGVYTANISTPAGAMPGRLRGMREIVLCQQSPVRES
jgi:hypothetical protein